LPLQLIAKIMLKSLNERPGPFTNGESFPASAEHHLPGENAWILASGNRLVWIVGKRLDDRFKITSVTKRILRIRLG